MLANTHSRAAMRTPIYPSWQLVNCQGVNWKWLCNCIRVLFYLGILFIYLDSVNRLSAPGQSVPRQNGCQPGPGPVNLFFMQDKITCGAMESNTIPFKMYWKRRFSFLRHTLEKKFSLIWPHKLCKMNRFIRKCVWVRTSNVHLLLGVCFFLLCVCVSCMCLLCCCGNLVQSHDIYKSQTHINWMNSLKQSKSAAWCLYSIYPNPCQTLKYTHTLTAMSPSIHLLDRIVPLL